ncbi:hypothetical protein V1478_006788 [Vespula squamosa]|uniref:Uncharacterized protein n=1 Tax=Vespula squamosa TaxID=30214 RepID=A0ABD2B145_VESSQ
MTKVLEVLVTNGRDVKLNEIIERRVDDRNKRKQSTSQEESKKEFRKVFALRYSKMDSSLSNDKRKSIDDAGAYAP